MKQLFAAVVVATLTSLGAGLLMAPNAAAEQLIPVPDVGAPGLISLSSSVSPLVFPALAANESYSWQLGVTLTNEPAGRAALQISAAGNLAEAGGYRIAVQECDTLWQGTSGKNQTLLCATGMRAVIATQPLADIDQAVTVPLRDLRPGTSPFLLVTLQRPADATALPTEPYLKLGIGVSGIGDDPADQPDNPLASTGAVLQPFLWAGGGLLVAGAAFSLARRRKDTSA